MIVKEECTGTGPACLQPLKRMCGEFWDKNRDEPVLLHTLRSVGQKNGLKNANCFVFSVPKCLFTCCEKEWQHYKVVNALPFQLECVADLKCRNGCILMNDMKTKHEISWVDIVCNDMKVKLNLRITVIFSIPFQLFWFGVVHAAVNGGEH